jgi:hypothetical protein
MAQITIYLPDEIENRARKAAKVKGTSVSRWIAAGAIPDLPDLKDIRAGYGRDATRERLR